MSNDGDIESSQRSFNGVSSSQVITTLQKNNKRTHPVGFFAPPHQHYHHWNPAIWTGVPTVFFCSSRWVLLRLQEKHLWMDKKYWKWRNSRATWTKSHGFFRVFCCFATPKFEKFSDFCWFPLWNEMICLHQDCIVPKTLLILPQFGLACLLPSNKPGGQS